MMSTVIEAFGSTSLVASGSNYFLDPVGGSAVELSYGGAPVVAGQFGQWAPIGAEQTASGYEVAWKVTGADQYTVWSTDNNGNYVSSAFASASGTSAALQSFETSFQQDLNGDGSIGLPAPPPPTVIEAFGSTSLVASGSNYFFDPVGGSAVELSYGGAPVVAGQFDQSGGPWAPIGAEQTASGYEVAWKVTGADQYTVWSTDNNGNYVSSAFAFASGTSAALQSFEPSFQQDLNGDGSIGLPAPPPPTIIEAFGSTSLVASGSNYFLDPVGGSAVELSYGGSPVVAGQFGQWAPIGAEQTASGYEVAWKVTGADQYTVWSTDNNGNYVSSAFASASGTSAALQSFETSFQQDLNGDGSIGPVAEVPRFVYQGVDSNGVQLYNVIWGTSGEHPFAVRVLAPDHPSTDYQHSFLYALPVEAGLAPSTFGDGLDELQQLDVQNKYNTTIIEPIFPIDPWYADNPTDATINYETFTATLLPAWVNSNLATSGTEENLLIGFSKSGYGGLDLLFKHPSVFDAVAAFDFPAGTAAYNGSPFGSYGTDTNFQNNYRLTDTFIDTWKAPFTTEDRIWVSEGEAFQPQVADFDALLTSQGVLHTFLTQTNDAHSWSGGWLSGAIAGLYSLVQTNWVTGVSGDWSTASDWLSGAVPTPIVDTVINNSNSVTLDGAAVAHALTLDNSDLTVSGTFTLGTSLTLDSLSELDLSGGVLSAQSIEVGASGHFLGNGTISSPVEVTGTIEVSQSALELTGAVSGTGLFTIDNVATLQFDGSVASGTTAAFLGASGTLIIEQPSSFNGHISGVSGSGDVLDLIGYDPAHTTATPTFNSGSDTTTLTVTDSAHALSVSLTLDGDYSNSTFTATSDGHSGTDVVDPPALGSAGASVSSDGSDDANGIITFANFNFTSTETANFIPEGSDYVRMFSLDPVSSSDGSASVGWEFHLSNDQIKLSPGETVTQSYDVTVNDEQSSTVNQTASVSVVGPGNDNFVFQPGIGADTIVNFNPQIDTIELDHFANVQSTQQLATLVTTDTHGNAVIDLGHNDSITLPNVNSAQLQAALQNAVHLH
jgi:20S proteasome alpha/beta subunit